MIYKTSLYRRLDFRYNDGWSHLDPTEFVCAAKIRQPRTVQLLDDGDVERTVRAVVPRGVDHRRVTKALINEFTYSNCRHEQDCCGCWHTRVRLVRRVSKREYVVVTNSYQNY